MTTPISTPNPAPQSNNPIVTAAGAMLQAFYQWVSTLDSSFRLVLALINLTLQGGGGIYVVTAKPYNAKGDGVTDDLAALQNAINDATANGGTVYLPGRRKYAISATLNVTCRVIGAGSDAPATAPASRILPLSNFGPTVALNGHGGDCVLEHLAVWGWNANNAVGDAVSVTSGHSLVQNVTITYGRYALNVGLPTTGGDSTFFNVVASNGVLSNCYQNAASSYYYRCSFDQGPNPNAVPLWAASTAYTAGQCVHVGSSPTGIILVCITGGTSGTSAPSTTSWSYDTAIPDGTGTLVWNVAAPWNNQFAALYLDVGASATNVDGCDLTGSNWNSIVMNSGGGTTPQALFVSHSDLNPLFTSLQANGGEGVYISDCQIGPNVATGSASSALLFQNSFLGNVTIANCQIVINAITTGIAMNAGGNYKIIGNDFLGGSGGGVAIAVGNSISDVAIEGNQLGGGSGAAGDFTANTNGVTIGNNCSKIVVKGNLIDRAATSAVTIGTSCTFVDVSHNTTAGVGAITNNSSGANGVMIVNNPGYNPVGTHGAITPGASPWTYTAGSSPESLHMTSSTGGISSVTINGGANLIPSGSPLNVNFELGPGDAMVTTYGGVLTATSFIH